MKRRNWILPAALLLSLALAGCVTSRRVRLPDEAAVYLGDDVAVSVRVDKMTVQTNTRYPAQKPLFAVTTTFRNTGATGVMRIACDYECYDRDGARVDTIHLTHTFEGTPLAPGGSAEVTREFRHACGASVVSVRVAVTEALSEEALPPIRLPAQGDAFFAAFADQQRGTLGERRGEALPVSAVVRIDNGVYPEAAVDDPATIEALLSAMADMTIGKETDQYVTDRYHAVSFVLPDGEAAHFSFNDHNLEINIYGKLHLYALENDDAFWKLASGIVEAAAERD